MIIDFQAHFSPREYIKIMSQRKSFPHFERGKDGSILMAYGTAPSMKASRKMLMDKLPDFDIRIKKMDSAGVDVQVLSLTIPGSGCVEPKLGRKLARMANDHAAKVSERYRGRFVGLASLSMRDVVAALDELDRAIVDLGLRGVGLHSDEGGEPLDSRKFWPIYERIEKHRIPIYIHPTFTQIPQLLDYGQALWGASFGYTFFTATALMRLILSGVFDRYPTLTVVIGHHGEALPFLLRRIDHAYKHRVRFENVCLPKISKQPSEYVKNNVYVDTAGDPHQPALRCTYDSLGPNKILFGSDYPHDDMSEAVEYVNKFQISSQDRSMIFEKNALKLLKIS